MHRVLPPLAILCLAFAPAPFPKPARSEKQTLQGLWVRQHVQNSRADAYRELLGRRPVQVKWSIADDTLTDRLSGGSLTP